MKPELVTSAFLYLSLVSALPIKNGAALSKRELPQEYSHNIFLDSVRKSLALNNPDGIVDPVYGLLTSIVNPSEPISEAF